MSVLKNSVRALRAPFILVSVLPFVFGSLIERSNFKFLGFFLGLIAVTATHLSANLINDYCDSKSGADWKDKTFFGFFGGSKLIQEKVFSDKFYLNLSIIFGSIAVFFVILLSSVLKAPRTILYFSIIIFLSWAYSQGPLRFAYRRLGEVIVFILCGPALVMGGYFIQTGIFPDMKSLTLSLPSGFLITAILFANEIPDYADDQKAGKNTWVTFLRPEKSYMIYSLLVFLGFFSVALGILLGYLGRITIISFALGILGIKAAIILKKYPHDKTILVKSSRLTIAMQVSLTLMLIAGLFS